MKRKKRERLAEGEVMYFISSLTYNVVQTHDCYFPTDDQRFEGGNYFPEAKACHACSDEIHETFVPRLEALDRLKAENLDKYVDVAKDVAKKMRSKMGSYSSKGNEDKRVKPDFEPLAIDLVEAFGAYETTHESLVKEVADVKKEIEEFIKQYRK